MNKNMIILLGLIGIWFAVVKMNTSNSKIYTQSTSTDTTVDNENATETNEQTTTTATTENHYVQVSKQNAVNTKSVYDNIDLSPYGNSYTS